MYNNNRSIVCGIPQGSTLHTKLLIPYINDMQYLKNPKILLFADDTIDIKETLLYMLCCDGMIAITITVKSLYKREMPYLLKNKH